MFHGRSGPCSLPRSVDSIGMSVSPVEPISPAHAIAATDANVSRFVVAERLSLLKQQQSKLGAQRETTQTDKAMDDKTRATMLTQLAVQQSRIDEQIRQMEIQMSDAAAEAAAAATTAASEAAEAAAATRTSASEAAEAAAATRTSASEAADAAAVSTTAAAPGSHIHVVA